jgi:glyoxylase-like metal-dependent hydrolase (beta-lactamase superfamily II)
VAREEAEGLMANFLCMTCGTQHAESEAPPERCLICADERQYVPAAGQRWTTLEAMRKTLMATFRDEAGVLGIGTAPSFGIGQRALLVRTPLGNVLWDCIALIDDAMVELIKGLGGIQAIAISHPHYYTTMVEWSRRFGDAPVYLHAADRQWVMRPDDCVQFWEGETKGILPGVTLIRAGGHYAGGTVLHWDRGGPEGRGALMTGDILQVTADSKFLGFMRSYPNFIPLGAAAVQRVADSVSGFAFDAIYGAFWDRVIPRGGRAALNASVTRHIHWLGRGALD